MIARGTALHAQKLLKVDAFSATSPPLVGIMEKGFAGVKSARIESIFGFLELLSAPTIVTKQLRFIRPRRTHSTSNCCNE